MVPTPQSLLQPGNLERLRTTFPGIDQLAGRVAASSLRGYTEIGLEGRSIWRFSPAAYHNVRHKDVLHYQKIQKIGPPHSGRSPRTSRCSKAVRRASTWAGEEKSSIWIWKRGYGGRILALYAVLCGWIPVYRHHDEPVSPGGTA